jgi:hypothetical protein
MGMKLYFWAGLDANMHEKTKALEVATGIKNDDRKSKPKLYYPREAGPEIEAEFWAELEGGKPDKIKPCKVEEHKEGESPESPFLNYKFFSVCETKNYVPEEIEDRPLTADMLLDDKSFILRTCSNIYVW